MVTLEPVRADDAGRIFDAWGSCADNFSHLTARVFSTLADAEHYLKGLFPTPESVAFHIVNGEYTIGIVKVAVFAHHAQLGYVVHKPFWGRGVATAAVRQALTAVIDAQPGISRVGATCALENPASARVLEKCGFEREGVLRNWVVYPAQGDRPFDNYSYSLIPQR